MFDQLKEMIKGAIDQLVAMFDAFVKAIMDIMDQIEGYFPEIPEETTAAE